MIINFSDSDKHHPVSHGVSVILVQFAVTYFGAYLVYVVEQMWREVGYLTCVGLRCLQITEAQFTLPNKSRREVEMLLAGFKAYIRRGPLKHDTLFWTILLSFLERLLEL